MHSEGIVTIRAAIILLLGCCWATSHAATVQLVGPPVVFTGDTFEIMIVGDFGDEGLLAGGVQILYDPANYSFAGYSTGLGVDPGLSCPGAGLCPVDPPGVISLVWGQFLIDLIPPGAGLTVMGIMTFNALQSGTVEDPLPPVFGIADFSDFTGGWFGAGFVTIATPELIGLNIPIPATIWLMFGALASLGALTQSPVRL